MFCHLKSGDGVTPGQAWLGHSPALGVLTWLNSPLSSHVMGITQHFLLLLSLGLPRELDSPLHLFAGARTGSGCASQKGQMVLLAHLGDAQTGFGWVGQSPAVLLLQ